MAGTPKMTSDPDGAGAAGVLRVAPEQLPRNHHGDLVAPLTPSGSPHQLRWVDHDHGGDLVYAETADELVYRMNRNGGRVTILPSGSQR